MDYKEKLEEAKRLYESANADQRYVLESLFPELAGSKDEQIRKELLEHCINRRDGKQVCVDASDYRRWADWLEKQDPKKHEEELEKAYKTADKVQYRRGYEAATKEMEKQGEQKPNPYSGTSFEYNGHTWGMCARDNGVDILCDKHIIGHLEKQGESYTKRDVDNAYIEGMAFAKNELEKQAEVVSDKDDIEAEEKGIRKAFNKIWEEKQDKQKSQRMISAEAKEAMYDKPADTVEQKCEESKTKIFDAPTPFEDKLYAFVLACEILVDPSKREFILEHSQEILDAAKEQIGKEQSSTWSKEDEKEYKYVLKFVDNILNNCGNKKDYEHCKRCYDWLKSLRPQNRWKPSDEQMADLWNMLCECRPADHQLLQDIYYGLKKLREDKL